jgi:hypothetical protein
MSVASASAQTLDQANRLLADLVPPPVVITPSAPPAVTASPDGTTIPPAAEIVDAAGAHWTLKGQNILKNGASAAGGTTA